LGHSPGHASGAAGIAEARPPHGYRAYGLSIRSDLPLPELEPDTADLPDLTIRLGRAGLPLPDPASETVYEFGEESQYVAWPGVGAFLIRGTSTIDIEPAPGVSEPLLNFPLLGPIMALLLHLRGMLVLHAGAVAVGGRGAVFLGAKGAGKSTTVAAFAAAGHRLLADDVLAVDVPQAGGPSIVPGFPQLKLVEDAASRLVLDGAVAMPPPVPDFPKQQRRLPGRFSHAAVTPHRIYVLARGEPARITALAAQDALGALLWFSFASIFKRRHMPLDRAQAGRHLAQCAALASAARVARLEVPGDLDRLGDIVRLVENDIGGDLDASGRGTAAAHQR
jgi:hypothetical protein